METALAATLAPPSSDPIFWNTRDTAAQLGLSVSHLEKMRFYRTPGAPPWVKINGAVRYPVSEVRAWAAERVAAAKAGAK